MGDGGRLIPALKFCGADIKRTMRLSDGRVVPMHCVRAVKSQGDRCYLHRDAREAGS